MLEVHPDPTNAAVDPLQAIDYDSYGTIMSAMHNVAEAIGRSVL